METPRMRNAKKISSIYRDPIARVRTLQVSDSRFVHIYYRLRIHRTLCTGECRSKQVCENESPGGWNAGGISGDAVTSIDSLPMSTIFRRVPRWSYTHDTSYVPPSPVRTTRNFLYGNQLSFDRCNRARARLCTCVNVARRAFPIACPDSYGDAVNMLIYWRRIRMHTGGEGVRVWFLWNSFRWMTGTFVGISVNCRRAEYWFLQPEKWRNNTSLKF